jgi:hypothetical protein
VRNATKKIRSRTHNWPLSRKRICVMMNREGKRFDAHRHD